MILMIIQAVDPMFFLGFPFFFLQKKQQECDRTLKDPLSDVGLLSDCANMDILKLWTNPQFPSIAVFLYQENSWI